MLEKELNTREQIISRIQSGEPPLDINNELPNAQLFHVKMIPRWSEHISEYLAADEHEIVFQKVNKQTWLKLAPLSS